MLRAADLGEGEEQGMLLLLKQEDLEEWGLDSPLMMGLTSSTRSKEKEVKLPR